MTLLALAACSSAGKRNCCHGHSRSSHGRQVYIEPNQNSANLPESLEITHDNITYRIFLSLDSQKCFKCNRQGHIASQCPFSTQLQTNIIETPPQSTNQLETANTQQVNEQQITTASSHEPATSQYTTNTQEAEVQSHIKPIQTEQQNTVALHDLTCNNQTDTQTSTSSKRNFSEAISPTTPIHDPSSDLTNSPIFPKPKNTRIKKQKTNSQPSYISQEAYEDVKTFIDAQTPAFILNSDQFKSLLENTHGTHNIMSIIQDYTDYTKGLIEMILLVYPHIADRAVKNRCTRLRKKLERYTDNNINECLSDTSSMDSTTY
ncbi:unnamed protein product [Acanthoscelides obtectus]|uniref:CCHC-type domain-containing protein n=1 Tax=Acanthoscelides obtectus TaxID=200917 RepID=A0A9P0PM80_ACAOB|nr:unnamed protein product [Acanthoscelides obtectus]CAK1641821.1 hypothetical protein AOBTE_LOCUS12658 [Acanthoscelides obtectus]